MSAIWTTCRNCGAQRDSSNRYTSPANAQRDYDAWQAEHGTGACIGGTMSATRVGPKMGDNRLTLDIGREMAEYLAEALSDATLLVQDPRAHRLSVLIDTALETGKATQVIAHV